MSNKQTESYLKNKFTRSKCSINRVQSSPALSKDYNYLDECLVTNTTPSSGNSENSINLRKSRIIMRLRSLFPITYWLPEYNVRECLMADILVGITVAIFQVPQSMGYCLIANVPPVYGLYSSFYPALFYSILGTGRHCAFGPFAIVSGVLTGDIIDKVMEQLGKSPDNSLIGSIEGPVVLTSTAVPIVDQFYGLKNIEIAIMVAIIIGTYILVFGIFQLGFVSKFMSEELISGFTISACIIVFFSQIRYLLGVDLSHFNGPFNLIKGIIEVFERLDEINLTTLKISGICLSILLIFKIGVNRLTAKCGIKTPFPIELCVVIGATLASHLMGLQYSPYNVKIVGKIGDK